LKKYFLADIRRDIIKTRYETYKTDVYSNSGDFYFAGDKDDMLRIGGLNTSLYDRFHSIYPNISNYKLMIPNDLREAHLKSRYNQTLQVIELNGKEMIADFMEVDLSFYVERSRSFSDEESIIKANEFSNSCIALCNKYGMLTWQTNDIQTTPPAIEEIRTDRIQSEFVRFISMGATPTQANNILADRMCNSLLFAFEAKEIIRSLILLRFLFLFWVVTVWGDDRYAFQLANAFDAFHDFPLISNTPRPYSHENCVRFAIDISKEFTLKRVLDISNSNPTIISQYANPLDAVIGSMIQLIGLGKKALDGKSIAECVRCGSTFIKRHGNKKLCYDCGSDLERSRASRERKKLKRDKEAKHGEKGEQ
jgi:hypothetical protein